MLTTSSTRRRILLRVLMVPLALACTGESPSTPDMPDQKELYWDLNLNHHAVTLSTTAPYDTLTLVATPRNIHQEPIPGLPMPQFVSADPKYVILTPEGRLIALAPMAPGTHIKVIATLTVNNLKHTDSVLVRVVDNPTPPTLATLSIHPTPTDSAKVAARRDGSDSKITYRVPMQAIDATGASMTDLLVSFRSSDDRIANFESEITGLVNGSLPGRVNLYAAATAFGIAKADTLRFRVGLPIGTRLVLRRRSDGPGNALDEPELRVGVGAAIMWQASSASATADLDITFTDPTHVAAFSTAPVYTSPATSVMRSLCTALSLAFGPEATNCTGSGSFVLHRYSRPTGLALGVAARVFPVPGIYDYHSTLQGISGRIVVVDESEP